MSRQQAFRAILSAHVISLHLEHLLTMARLHAANRYDRLTDDVRTITGRLATSTRNFVARHADLFAISPQ